MKIKKLVEKGLDLIYPQSLYCICCGNYIDDTRKYSLCDHCMEHIKWSGYDRKTINGLNIMWCTDYSLYSRRIIFALKYNGKKYISRIIAEIMRDKMNIIDYEFEYIVPVPISESRKSERGFNQMGLAGKHLAELTETICVEEALIRRKDTKPMRGLSPMERKENIKGSIELNQKYGKILKNKKILLIDDFFTTGSTATECYRALQKAQPAEVLFLSFAAK